VSERLSECVCKFVCECVCAVCVCVFSCMCVCACVCVYVCAGKWIRTKCGRTRWGLEWVRKAVSNPFVVLDLVVSTCPANVREGLTTVTVKHATDVCVGPESDCA
jgi:hypothetical protein